jgi:hypothetical protein
LLARDAFLPIDLSAKTIFDEVLRIDPMGISELTFTNLFVWRKRYRPLWRLRDGCLLIIMNPEGEAAFALPPAGTGDKREAMDYLAGYLQAEFGSSRFCRVPEHFLDKYVDKSRFHFLPDRDNSDYVYRTQDLIELSGNRLHAKKNHVNRFKRENKFQYRSMNLETVEMVLDMQEEWCQMKSCTQDPDLMSEDYAIKETLTNFDKLEVKGGLILMNGRVEAFSLGEMLSPDTAVIHFEKANPTINGLYAAINQMFCQNEWYHTSFVNREQDLGREGLRKAKESYRPHHMVNKFTVVPERQW